MDFAPGCGDFSRCPKSLNPKNRKIQSVFLAVTSFFRSRLNLFFAVCLLLGLVFRVVNLNWDEGAGLHPDERFCASLLPEIRWPMSWDEYFNSKIAPLNPANVKDKHYVYGQIPLFLGKIVVGDNGDFAASATNLRALSGFFDFLTVLFTFFIARRLLGGRAALLAVTLVSLAALHIQQSHFFTTDTFAAAFTTMAFWSGVRWIQREKHWDLVGAGAFFGLALACKISSAFFGAALLGFWILGARKFGFRATISPILVSFWAAILVFRVGHPMAFVGEKWLGIGDLRPEKRFWEFLPTFKTAPSSVPAAVCALVLFVAAIWAIRKWGFRSAFPAVFAASLLAFAFFRWVYPLEKLNIGGDFGYQMLITRGEIDVPFNVQWIGRADWIFPFKNLGFWAYGWPFLLSGVAGGLWLLKNPKKEPLLVLGAFFGLILFGIQGHEFSKFTRYYLPLTPFCALLAAYFWREMSQRKPIFRWGAPLVVVCALFWAICVTSIYTRRHTRLQASSWIVGNLAPGTAVVNETPWDEGLPISWIASGTGDLGFVRDANLKIDGALGTYDLDNPEKREKLLLILQKTEWIFFSSGRSWQNIPRWPRKWPLMTRFYEKLWSGELGFKLEREFTSYPRFGPLQFPDDDAEEALSVYDHPRVLLWKKQPDFNIENARAILESVTLPTETQWRPNDPENPTQ